MAILSLTGTVILIGTSPSKSAITFSVSAIGMLIT